MKPGLYGMVAEFADAEALRAAAAHAKQSGYRRMDAFSPIPVEGVAESVGRKSSVVPAWVLAGGVTGGLTGYALQFWGVGINYPFNVGGRPLNSWPLFIPITFELTILGAALMTILSLFVLNGLPRLHHPIFSTPGFERATTDAFFLCIEADDPQFDARLVRRFFEDQTGAIAVSELRR